MADENVKKAQAYLNAMYGHRSEWIPLEENGYTGTVTVSGVIRAFQLQNGLDPVGSVGPDTLKKFKSLPVIEKMNPDDSSIPNVCLLQCALFFKGYAAGGITGIYYTSGVNAVTKLQEDANIDVTGKVDWKVWAALLSFNWFTEPANPLTKWDRKIQIIQRQLNKEYSDYLSVRACDGIMSRETALSVLGALQAAEGILSPNDTLTNLNELNFGEQTTALFPGPLVSGNSKTKFNKLVQYGLYFNGYDPGNFDGVFDDATRAAVTNFQNFYAIADVIKEDIGTVDVSTMQSLLVSRGDTSRYAEACDCSVILNKQQTLDLQKAEYKCVGRYLTGTVGKDFRPKALTVAEIERITSAGLHIFPIYQDGGYYLDYFKNPSQGSTDATIAIQTATRLGFLHETTIYFAVDFDCLPHETDDYIIKYFQEIYGVFNSSLNEKRYKIGVYGPRQVCIALADKMLTTSSFVSDMSSGFTGNCGYPLPKNWAFDQFFETTFTSSPAFSIDKVARSLEPGEDQGCIDFDEVEYISKQERINALYRKCLDDFTVATTHLENIFTADINLPDCSIQIAHFPSANMEINMYIVTKEKVVVVPDSPSEISIPIELRPDGTVTANFERTLKQVLSKLDTSGFSEQFYNMAFKKCISIAEKMQVGTITVKVELKEPNCTELSVTWKTNKLYLPSDGEGSDSCYLEFSIGWVVQIVIYTPEYKLASEVISYAATACAICLVGWALVELGAIAGVGLGTVTTISTALDSIFKLLEKAEIIFLT